MYTAQEYDSPTEYPFESQDKLIPGSIGFDGSKGGVYRWFAYGSTRPLTLICAPHGFRLFCCISLPHGNLNTLYKGRKK
jgi:hypothetical protein